MRTGYKSFFRQNRFKEPLQTRFSCTELSGSTLEELEDLNHPTASIPFDLDLNNIRIRFMIAAFPAVLGLIKWREQWKKKRKKRLKSLGINSSNNKTSAFLGRCF